VDLEWADPVADREEDLADPWAAWVVIGAGVPRIILRLRYAAAGFDGRVVSGEGATAIEAAGA
jgi:hypothetical protein